MSQAQVMTLLRDGMAAARRGDKPLTQKLLRQAVELDARNETVWLWLGGVAETPREALSCLLRVLELNPSNERAQAGLKSAYLQAGIDAAKAKERSQAYQWLQEASRRDPGNESAWLWLAGVAETPEESLAHLERVLEINPQNDRARQGIDYFKKQIAAARATRNCPMCQAQADQLAEQCPACGSALTLKNVDLFLDNPKLHRDIVERAADCLGELAERQPTFDSCFHVGMALLNLGQFDNAMPYLQTALRLKPTDLEFSGLVASLLNRKELAEEKRRQFRQQQEAQSKAERRRTILVVDDSPTIRKLVSLTLEKAEHRVLTASEPHEAMETMRTEGVPDLIFLDINMPRMDGYQFCKLLRYHKETAKLPIIMLSGKDGMFSKLRGSWAGSTEYITKPFRPEKLLQVVEKFCRDAQRV